MSSEEPRRGVIAAARGRRRRGGAEAGAERHLAHRAGWLRAAVLGANDGILSTASLVLGVAAAGASRGAIVTAGVAGLVAGATAMAAGEYVSVSSQRDTERADLALERRELAETPDFERAELAAIWVARGLSHELAERVADELSAGDRLVAHARDELGIDPDKLAQPLQAAWTSAVSFATGAAVPLITIAFVPAGARIPVAIAVTLIALSALGVAGARIGGAPALRAALRVVLGGVFAMGVTIGIGALVGTAV
jgi:VIT1/CCC1 family predicted Fe2+/Mn2+ transporter